MVTERDAGVRLDLHILSICTTSSRGLVRRAIEAGYVQVNGVGIRRKAWRTRAGDRVEVTFLPERGEPWVQPDPSLSLPILARSTSWLAVSKPSGVPVYPLKMNEKGTLANALADQVPECISIGEVDTGMGGILHRLDTGTSGVLIVASTVAGWRCLRSQFQSGSVEKVYLAVVEGIVGSAGQVISWLMHTPGRPGHMQVLDGPPAEVSRRAMRAVTTYAPLKYGRNRTLLRITIQTGVTHQIRCQLAHCGHPVIGDTQYGSGSGRGTEGAGRYWLHATEIEFEDPDSGGRRRVISPPPLEFMDMLDDRPS